ncbi:MAG: nucleoside hydrolase [Terracidiphilus sp.]|jgi:inosine-uridine nucleoside N-ribohydrolase
MKILRLALVVGGAALAIGGLAAVSGQAPASDGRAPARPQFAILDTDIGDDIDDAFALALALRSPELYLLGITTAYGDTDLRMELVDRFLEEQCRRGLPVVPGKPTDHQNVMTQAAYAKSGYSNGCAGSFNLMAMTGKNGEALEHERKEYDAAGFILRQIREYPGQITLIAIGPLNNIEAAIKKDPTTFRKLKRVVMMGGSIYRGYDGRNGERRPPDAEWNISRDPAGLRALLASGVPVFMMPLDSTQIHLETKEREEIFAHGSPLTDQLTLLYHQWKAGSEGHPDAPTLFDPVAVAYAIRPDLCPATPMRLEVDDKGFTRPVDGAPNAQVCLKSDEKGFLDLLLGRLTDQDQK